MSGNAEFLSNWRTTRGIQVGDDSEGIASKAKSVFSAFTDRVQEGYNSAYSALPLHNQDLDAQQEPSWFKLSRFERLVCFFCFIAGSIVCFGLGILLFPVLTLKPRKFAMLWTLGSILFVLSFGCLQGPVDYCKHLVSKERLPFTVVFFGSVLSTLYCAAVLKSTILTLITGIIEIFACFRVLGVYYGVDTQLIFNDLFIIIAYKATCQLPTKPPVSSAKSSKVGSIGLANGWYTSSNHVGEIPSFKLLETKYSYSFLDIQPTSKGHLLVIPKYHGAMLHNIPDEYLADILPVTKKLVKALGLEVTTPNEDGYNVLQNNGRIAHQVVDHVHFHLIPKRDPETGLVIGWPAKNADMGELSEFAKELTAKLV
ncbi:hypothetical protein KL942_003662 [Ogataea angusta]|uniref:HIT domain-containing protein n=1 Tax=Pichia angusta TaxID=870730 RepID=A0ABQ7RWV7_PICAN|nr:hypothetical protein KL942_003662 [Ogataea angusta]KAG7849589.1 hypothetical protein KL940_002619 [Ogataea angusta]